MAPMFTKSLVERLNNVSQIKVAEASNGSAIESGQVLLAPGGFHMVAGKGNRVMFNQDPSILGVRPSIDVTMKSVVEVNDTPILGVVLAGMGSDSTLRVSRIKAAGGKIIAEDESSCVVYGMPQSVVKAGYADKVLPLSQIAPELIQIYRSNSQPNSRSLCHEPG